MKLITEQELERLTDLQGLMIVRQSARVGVVMSPKAHERQIEFTNLWEYHMQWLLDLVDKLIREDVNGKA